MRDTSADSRYRVDITMTFTDNKITKCVFTAWDQTLGLKYCQVCVHNVHCLLMLTRQHEESRL